MTLLQARTTKIVLSGALFLFGLLFLAPSDFANVTPIHVNNPSFETLPSGGLTDTCPGHNCEFSRGDIPGWTVPPGSIDTGQLRPSTSGMGHLFETFAPHNGEVSAFSNGPTISQEVGPTVAEGVPYTLTVDLGRRNDTPFEASADLLLSGNGLSPVTILATGKTPVHGHWSTFTATFVGDSTTVGDNITIQLKSGGVQGNFDSVTLTTVPEPGTLLLFGSGLLLFGIIAYRNELRAKAGNVGVIDMA